MDKELEDFGSVYIVLSGDDSGVKWQFIQPLPVGVVLQAATALTNMVNNQPIGPAPPPEIEGE